MYVFREKSPIQEICHPFNTYCLFLVCSCQICPLFIKDCRALFDLSFSRNVMEYRMSSWRQAQGVYSGEGYSNSVPRDFNPHIYLINIFLLNVFLHSENVS